MSAKTGRGSVYIFRALQGIKYNFYPHLFPSFMVEHP
jgi:hypothetical protein